VTCAHGGPTPANFKERFPGLGMPKSKNPGQAGDFVVEVEIWMPQTLTTSGKGELDLILETEGLGMAFPINHQAS